MDTLLLLMAVSGVLFYIFLPYFKKTRMLFGAASGDNNSNELYVDYHNLLATIKELEFDHTIGNLSPEDYNEMNSRYRHEAVMLLKRIDSLKSGNNTKRKQKRSPDIVQTKQKSKKGAYCPNCGSPVGKQHLFCSNCGSRLV